MVTAEDTNTTLNETDYAYYYYDGDAMLNGTTNSSELILEIENPLFAPELAWVFTCIAISISGTVFLFYLSQAATLDLALSNSP